MATIVPSILEDNPEAFADRLAQIVKIPDVTRIQVDISDGKFTPRKTIQPSELDLLNPAFHWEAHLMVQNPEEYFFDAQLAGFNTIIVHSEAAKSAEDLRRWAKAIAEMKLTPSVAISTESDIDEVLGYLENFEQLLLLSVKAGYQGQAMSQRVFDCLKSLENRPKNVKIEVDGGVKFDNAKKLVQAGADMLVVGSALFDSSGTPLQNFEHFETETNLAA